MRLRGSSSAFVITLIFAGIGCDTSSDNGHETGAAHGTAEDDGSEETAHGDETGHDETGHDEVPAPYSGQVNPNDPGDQAAIDAGAMSWASSCASCHGDSGAGDGAAGTALDPPPTDFSQAGAVDGLEDDYLLWVISDGIEGTGMPGYSASLSEEQIWQIATFMATLDG